MICSKNSAGSQRTGDRLLKKVVAMNQEKSAKQVTQAMIRAYLEKV